MADEHDPKNEPEVEPEGGGGDGPKDSRGQEGISKVKYECERREWEAKVAALRRSLVPRSCSSTTMSPTKLATLFQLSPVLGK
ncbi:hypothetical protein HF885_10120 [Olsenella umbonata]|uniref:Uncharacterized protein n=1 Tax=Parafannyhessea umbonata TaxID=604330 RepID=A0A7X9TC88_9ACTN|nr:hypothetical protein [Parafannyhessea umbonata]NMF26764.1 hypothetical protein [Parafannyhessea umbonata]